MTSKQYGVYAGNNKYGRTTCPFCKAKGELIDWQGQEQQLVFLFDDHLSAREYQISGLCQGCQDTVFK